MRYILKTFVVYLEFKLNWVSCILSDNLKKKEKRKEGSEEEREPRKEKIRQSQEVS